jgi:hypothetical protein
MCSKYKTFGSGCSGSVAGIEPPKGVFTCDACERRWLF